MLVRTGRTRPLSKPGIPTQKEWEAQNGPVVTKALPTLPSTAARLRWLKARDDLRLNRIPADDRLWITLREDFIPAQVLHEFVCRCAERAMAHVDHPDPRSIAAIKAKRQWLAGDITDEELTRARSAAWVAAWPAARDAAKFAACDAARDAAAAYATERKAQIDMLIEMLLEAQL